MTVLIKNNKCSSDFTAQSNIKVPQTKTKPGLMKSNKTVKYIGVTQHDKDPKHTSNSELQLQPGQSVNRRGGEC